MLETEELGDKIKIKKKKIKKANIIIIWLLGIIVYTSLNVIVYGMDSPILYRDLFFYIGWFLASLGIEMELYKAKPSKGISTNTK